VEQGWGASWQRRSAQSGQHEQRRRRANGSSRNELRGRVGGNTSSLGKRNEGRPGMREGGAPWADHGRDGRTRTRKTSRVSTLTDKKKPAKKKMSVV
jgi:hypothetical protein